MKNRTEHIDHIVKDALLEEAGRYSAEEDLFCRIKEQIATGTTRSNKFKIGRTYLISVRRKVSIAICLFVACTILAFTSSSQVRAFAMQTVSSIKTIFVMDVVDHKVQIVEKPVTEALGYYGSSVTVYHEPYYSDGYFDDIYHGKTDLSSDENLGKILGFRINYPQSLGNSFKEPFVLSEKSFGIVLKKPIDSETSSTLREEAIKAIEDEDAFNRLGKYEPFRKVLGYYRQGGQHAFFIVITQAWSLSEMESQSEKFPGRPRKVKVGELNALWQKIPYPVYPYKTVNGYITSDRSSRPEIEYSDSLFWEKDKITYMLQTEGKFKLSLKDAIKIAKEFMEKN